MKILSSQAGVTSDAPWLTDTRWLRYFSLVLRTVKNSRFFYPSTYTSVKYPSIKGEGVGGEERKW